MTPYFPVIASGSEAISSLDCFGRCHLFPFLAHCTRNNSPRDDSPICHCERKAEQWQAGLENPAYRCILIPLSLRTKGVAISSLDCFGRGIYPEQSRRTPSQ